MSIIAEVSSQGELRDLREELRAQLYTDLDPEQYVDDMWGYWRRLPAPDPEFSSVFVTNERASWGPAHEWHVETDVDMTAADVEKVDTLIRALTTAALQARILNSTGPVYAISRRGDCRHGKTEGPFHLIRCQEGNPVWYDHYEMRHLENLRDREPGYTWGEVDPDVVLHFTYIGRFTVIGEGEDNTVIIAEVD